MEWTINDGQNWERTQALNKKDTALIQPSILVFNDGRLEILCRSKVSKILSSWSVDNGRTWSAFKSTGLPNPNSGIDAVSLRDGRHLLVYNHLTRGRNMLNLAVSGDGNLWEAAVLLENDKKDAEYSYPAVIQTSDGMVHITYTWNRKLIRHVVLDPSILEKRSFIKGDWPTE